MLNPFANATARRMLTGRAFSTSHTFKLVSATFKFNYMIDFSQQSKECTILKDRHLLQQQRQIRTSFCTITPKWL